MKKGTLIIILLLFGISVIAQTEDKKWGMGLGAGIYENDGLGSYGFMPQLSLSRY